jgi:hypothetical protein
VARTPSRTSDALRVWGLGCPMREGEEERWNSPAVAAAAGEEGCVVSRRCDPAPLSSSSTPADLEGAWGRQADKAAGTAGGQR